MAWSGLVNSQVLLDEWIRCRQNPAVALITADKLITADIKVDMNKTIECHRRYLFIHSGLREYYMTLHSGLREYYMTYTRPSLNKR